MNWLPRTEARAPDGYESCHLLSPISVILSKCRCEAAARAKAQESAKDCGAEPSAVSD